MNGTLSGLTMNVLILVAFIATVVVALRVAQSVFGTGSKRAAATEVAAKLVSYPTGSAAVLRRRFVRALTSQHVIMPSGERLAFAELTVRVAPEDLDRLDPDGDVERLGSDAAKLYLAHAKREGWAVPATMSVIVEVDPGLRSGWVPPARGTGNPEAARARAEDVPLAARGRGVGWDVVTPQPSVSPVHDMADAATQSYPVLVPDLEEAGTVIVADVLQLQRGTELTVVPPGGTTVLGRLPESPVTLAEPEVSYRHAALRQHAGQWQIKDLGSTNGTTVDGTLIAPDAWVTLRGGSSLALAGVRLVAVLEAGGTVHLADRRAGVTSR